MAEAVKALRTGGGIAGAINGIEQMKAWPHLAAREMLVPLEHPLAGPVPDTVAAGFPLKFSASKPGYATPSPWPGQDNDAVYGEYLAIPTDKRDELAKRGII